MEKQKLMKDDNVKHQKELVCCHSLSSCMSRRWNDNDF